MFESITTRLGDIFRMLQRKGKLSRKDVEKGLREIRLALLEADVNYRVVKSFIDRLEEAATGERVLKSFTPGDTLRKVVYEELRDFLADSEKQDLRVDGKPGVLMLMGLQGSGKTTTAVKIAHLLRKKGKKCLLVPCDLKRPAAVEQLRIMAEREQLPFYEVSEKSVNDIAINAVNRAKEHGLNTVILDTAGRLHIDEEMVKELALLQQAVEPKEILLVLDAMTGQDAVTIGLEFQKQVDFNGIVLSKMDGDARGGAALSLRFVTERPIKLVGTGEKPDDLEFFHAERMASRILGMGDLSTLAERAASIIDKEEAEDAEKKLREDRFTLEDFRKQIKSIRKLGSLDAIVGMMPGMKSLRGMKVDDASIDRIEAIINSMTLEERANPKVINGSRRKRIARGSGTSVSEINRLLKDFEAMRKMMTQFTKGKMGMPPGLQFPTG
jgi:signal recognition particle subunit SRP54